MGVKNLLPNLRNECPQIFHTIDERWLFFQGKTIAVDVAIWMYRFWSYDPNIEKDRKKRLSLLCQRFWTQYEFFRQKGIDLIFVFDGTAPIEKADEKERRRQVSEKRLEKKRLETGDVQTMEDIRPTLNDYNTLRQFLLLNLIPCVRAAGEGEMGCAWLVHMGVADAVLTSDSDSLPCGAKIVIFDIPRKETQYVILDELLSGLQLNLSQFQDVCVLMGTDFNPKVPRMKFTEAVHLLRKYGDLTTTMQTIEFAPFLYRLQKAGQLLKFNPAATKRIFDVTQATPSFDDQDMINSLSGLFHQLCDDLVDFQSHLCFRMRRPHYKIDPSLQKSRMYSILRLMMPDTDHSPIINRPVEMILDSEELEIMQNGSVMKSTGSSSSTRPVIVLDDEEIRLLTSTYHLTQS